jgi:hypothetical protein
VRFSIAAGSGAYIRSSNVSERGSSGPHPNRSPLFMKPRPAPAAKPRIEPTDSADAIATVLVGMFLPRKAEAIFRAGLAQLTARGAPPPDLIAPPRSVLSRREFGLRVLRK